MIRNGRLSRVIGISKNTYAQEKTLYRPSHGENRGSSPLGSARFRCKINILLGGSRRFPARTNGEQEIISADGRRSSTQDSEAWIDSPPSALRLFACLAAKRRVSF
jgi:hypothetical protein